MIGKGGACTSGRTFVSGLVSFFLISSVLPIMSFGAGLEIRQENYQYQMSFAQAVFTETFVISPVTKQHPGKVGIPDKPAPITLYPAPHFTHPITVHFKIDSAEIVPEEQAKMLYGLDEFEVTHNAPLSVTGFTCRMGTTEFNVWLSEERAKAVAKLLEKEGYTVAKIEGKGASDLVSEHYAPINRRVEITPFKINPALIGQHQISTKEETP